MHAQSAHFGTRHETSKSLAHPCDASAYLNVSSAGSPRFYTQLPRPQTRSGDAAPAGAHTACGGDAPGNTRAPYESPDDGDSVCANAPAPRLLCPPLAG